MDEIIAALQCHDQDAELSLSPSATNLLSPGDSAFGFEEFAMTQSSNQSSATDYKSETKMSPVARSRLATWTFSPDSGYADSLASYGTSTSSPARYTRGAKRRANSLEISAEIGNVTLRQDSIPEHDFGVTNVERQPSPAEDSFVYPSRVGSTELVVLRQPETQHRPRYQTEGSRGRIKDRSGSLSPAVQLKNFQGRSAVLQVFVAVEEGVPHPHRLFKICKVNNKTVAPAVVRELWDKVTVLEMMFSAKRDWTIDVDCISLTKLRNVDCEENMKGADLAKSIRKSRGQGGSPKIRLAFRAILSMPDGNKQILQTTSTPISCCSSLGVPEINFVSHKNCPVSGGVEIVVIGRSFLKNDSRLFVVEKSMDDDLIWESEAAQMADKFNQVHLVARIPPFRDITVRQSVSVYLCVRNADGKQSDLFPFTYTAINFPVSNPLIVHDPGPNQQQLIIASSEISDLPATQQQMRHASLPLVETNTSVASVASSGTHYCIELPGMLQPIIITVPQFASVEIPTVISPMDNRNSASAIVDLNSSMQSQLVADSSLKGYSLEIVSNSEQTNNQEDVERESKAFDDLLREILGQDAMESSDNTQAAALPNDGSWILEMENDQYGDQDRMDFASS